MKVISCAGFGCTGSSIITDFFRECSNVYSVGGNGLEFFLLHEPDGIKDLENALLEGHRFKVDLAIKRFKSLVTTLQYNNPSGPNYKDFFNGKFLEITDKFLESLGIVNWNQGWWHRIFENDNKKIYRFVKNLRFKKYVEKEYSLYEPDAWKPVYTGYATEYYCHVSKEFFIQKTKKYLNNLFAEINTNAEYLLFDQLFPPSNTEEYIIYFDFAKVFVVDRDPRDLYFANKIFWGCGFMPSNCVESYIEWFINTRKTVKYGPNVCLLSFEDFLYKTVDTQKKIMDFVGLLYSEHDKEKTYFFPEKSIKNTQLYSRYYFEDQNIQCIIDEDIRKIEINLKKFLYDFTAFDSFDSNERKKVNFLYEKCYKKVSTEKFYISILKSLPSMFMYVIRKIIRRKK